MLDQRYTHEVVSTYPNGFTSFTSHRSKAAASRAANLRKKHEPKAVHEVRCSRYARPSE